MKKAARTMDSKNELTSQPLSDSCAASSAKRCSLHAHFASGCGGRPGGGGASPGRSPWHRIPRTEHTQSPGVKPMEKVDLS
jgi:hypothetical protein